MNVDEEFYFCYSYPLYHFLHDDCKFESIMIALHIKTHRRFWLFKRSEKLNNAIDKYKEIVHEINN
jgi:hypothetical protein